MGKQRNTFTGKLGYVLAAAGASVGLGNIWRFPYLTAQYGGGIFLLVYIVLAVTFGYTMIMSESAIGRMTGKSPVGAFSASGGKIFKAGGWMNAIIPMLIVPYYSVIGGWVLKYFYSYITSDYVNVVNDNFFTNFLGNAKEQVIFFVVFVLCDLLVIFFGVKNGIERVSKIVMPLLVVLAIGLSIYSMTLDGAWEGVKYFFIPDFSKFSLKTVIAALGQMFYSLSIAMGILITFGSYMKKDSDMEKAAVQVEVFDTVIAVLAGLMIIPAVFAFSSGNMENLKGGPSLMFVTMPKVFATMPGGRIVGMLFFVLVFIAALTSAIALTETCVATFEDETRMRRKSSTLVSGVITVALGILSCLGFNVLSKVTFINGSMTILDFFDFVTNSVLLPLSAILICILVLRKIKIENIEKEVMQSSAFKRRKLFRFVLKYLAIPFLAVILVSSVLSALGIITI